MNILKKDSTKCPTIATALYKIILRKCFVQFFASIPVHMNWQACMASSRMSLNIRAFNGGVNHSETFEREEKFQWYHFKLTVLVKKNL